MSGALLLRSSGSVQIYWRLCERLLYVDHVRYVWSWTIRGPSVKSVWRVSRVFSCRVYIDSNRHDFRIWVPLICDSHHIDNLMTWMQHEVRRGRGGRRFACNAHRRNKRRLRLDKEEAKARRGKERWSSNTLYHTWSLSVCIWNQRGVEGCLDC
jgi:hypothetical protein